jgi:hypothetical protein
MLDFTMLILPVDEAIPCNMFLQNALLRPQFALAF